MSKMFERQLEFLYDMANRNMDEFDSIDDTYYFCDNTCIEQGHGFKFIGSKDNFQPFFIVQYDIMGGNTIGATIFVENRNGNDIVYGNTIAIYSLKFEYSEQMSDDEIKEIDNRYRKMIRYTLDKWSKYNEENQLGYIKEEERKVF